MMHYLSQLLSCNTHTHTHGLSTHIIVVIKHHGDLFFPQIEELEAGTPGRLKVTAKSTESNEIYEGEYNTVSVEPFYWPKTGITFRYHYSTSASILSAIFGSVSNPSVCLLLFEHFSDILLSLH